MPPNLTADEIAQLKKEQAKAVSAAETFTNQIAAQQAEATRLSVIDGSFKKFFDYYDADIIGRYNNERRLINGQYVDTPVIEADIISVASLAGGRLQPTMPATDVVRIAQFDGTPLLQDSVTEFTRIQDQSDAEDHLTIGWGGSSPPGTVQTQTAISSGTTSILLENSNPAVFSITPGSVFVVQTGLDLAVIRIDTFVFNPSPPPHSANCNITVIVPPSGVIPIGQNLVAFNGFTNAERTAKITTDPQLQPLMDYLIQDLEDKIDLRISQMSPQLVQIAANQDPDGTTELTQATSDVNASITYLNNYKTTMIVSDTGLLGLSTERATRSGQATARVAQIVAAFTGQTLNYFDERYNMANNRSNTSRGSLRLQKNAEMVSQTSSDFAQTLGDQAAAISSILP